MKTSQYYTKNSQMLVKRILNLNSIVSLMSLILLIYLPIYFCVFYLILYAFLELKWQQYPTLYESFILSWNSLLNKEKFRKISVV